MKNQIILYSDGNSKICSTEWVMNTIIFTIGMSWKNKRRKDKDNCQLVDKGTERGIVNQQEIDQINISMMLKTKAGINLRLVAWDFSRSKLIMTIICYPTIFNIKWFKIKVKLSLTLISDMKPLPITGSLTLTQLGICRTPTNDFFFNEALNDEMYIF